MGVRCSGLIKKKQIVMEERAPQNGCFFIVFVFFTNTLVYSVVWNQSLGIHIFICKK